MIWAVISKHRFMLMALIWKNRSPGVAMAMYFDPASSGNGCKPAGRGPPNKRSQAAEPIPATHASAPAGTRAPTDRCRPARSGSRPRTACSPPGLTRTTRKIAVPVGGLSTGCGTGATGCCGFVTCGAPRERSRHTLPR